MLLKRFFLLVGMVVLLAACSKVHVPMVNSMSDVDVSAVNNGEKSLVMMRVSSPWGSPAETRWLHVETGNLYKVTSQFGANTQEKAREYDIVTLPAGRYALVWVMYSDGTLGTWPSSPFDLDPTKSRVTRLGQIETRLIKHESGPDTTISALRSKGLAKDGKTPLIAGFTITPGKSLFLGNMVIEFKIQGKQQLPGFYPAGSVAYSLTTKELERARLVLAKEDAGLAEKLTSHGVVRGSLARQR